MNNLKLQNKSNQAQSLIDLLAQHRDIADYLRLATPPSNYQKLALQLIREGIASRSRNQKHYNVSFVKHNRFLSPSQKDVAQKITQIIPVSHQPIKIYGKPRVKLDDQYLNPVQQIQQFYTHSQVEADYRSESQRNFDKHLPPQNDAAEKQENQKQNKQMQEMDKIFNNKAAQTADLQQPIKSPQNEKKKKQKDKKQQKMDLKIQSNFKTTLKPCVSEKMININSPKNARHPQKHEQVESKIKFLIDRDKKNKKLQNKLQQQNRKIQKLEQRQQRLLLRQYEQNKELTKQSSHQRKQLPCCCSSDEQITSKLLEMKTLQNYSSHKMLSNLKSKISPIKSYKISTNPVYPMTSSDSSDSSESEIVVAVR